MAGNQKDGQNVNKKVRGKIGGPIIKGTVAFFDTIKAGTRLQTKSQAEAWLVF